MELTMRPDLEIKRDAEEHLRWDPAVDATDIAVTVQEGIVALSGFVRSYAQKREAERDAKRVSGVLGVANDIAVRLLATDERPDAQIARDVVSALRMLLPYTSEQLKVIVKEGWLTIDGIVEWQYARERGLRAIEQTSGVKGLTSLICLRPPVTTSQIRENVEKQWSSGERIVAQPSERAGATSSDGLRSWAERSDARAALPPPPLPMRP
jgi:osmotically-inducible protein OsmY